MKSNAIIRILLWSVVLVVLIGILMAFMAEEAYLNDYSAESVPINITEAALVPVPNEEKISIDPDAIREIKIEWAAGNIMLLPVDTDTITISESDVLEPEYRMLYQTKGDKLEILFCKETLATGLNIGLSEIRSKDLYIQVPKNWGCDALEIDAASATLEMHNMTIGELDFDGASGTCDFQNCHIDDLDINTASGDVYFSGTLNTLDFDSASASFIGNLQNTPNRIDMDGMSGKLDVALPEDCGFSLTMEGISSSFNSEFYGTTMRNNAHVYGDGRCRINVDGMSCNVTIRKLETIE